MPVTLAALFEIALVAGSLACGGTGTAVASRTRAAARADRLALRLARARESAFVDAARRLATAARESVVAVRNEIAHAARVTAPAVDGVLMYEQQDAVLTCIAAFGDRFAYFAGSSIAMEDASALPARAIAAGHRITLADAGVRALHPTDVAALAVPLALDTGRACVLVATAQQPLDPAAVERLVTLADQASPAYLIALDREHDRRSAEYDGLTGLLTPRAFRRRLNALVDRARFASNVRLALLFVDTDRFKQYNDYHGHAAGDRLLRELANVLRSAAVSEHDLIARNGGDEFCIVFTDTDKAPAIERAHDLQQRIALLDLTRLYPPGCRLEDNLRITASIGVAAFPGDASTANDLLERADAAMYHTKHTGRDGVSYVGEGTRLTRLR